MRYRILRAAVVVFSGLALAQLPTGESGGIVRDSTQAAVAGATVVITNEATGETKTVIAGTGGDYLTLQLPPGAYRIVASKDGFRTSEHDDVVPTALQSLRV